MLFENCRAILDSTQCFYGNKENLCQDLASVPVVTVFSDAYGTTVVGNNHKTAFYNTRLLDFCKVVLENKQYFKDRTFVNQDMSFEGTTRVPYKMEDYIDLIDKPVWRIGIRFTLYGVRKDGCILRARSGDVKLVHFNEMANDFYTIDGKQLFKIEKKVLWQGS